MKDTLSEIRVSVPSGLLAAALLLSSCERDHPVPSAEDLRDSRGALPAAGMIEAHPLANRVARGEEETLFEELRAERTGIDFGLSWDDPASVLKEFIFLNPSGGICTGDCDGDGLVDKEELREL